MSKSKFLYIGIAIFLLGVTQQVWAQSVASPGTVPASVVQTATSANKIAVSAVTAGVSHTCVLTVEGGVVCWGVNAAGQLGDGTFTQSLSPVAVTGLTNKVNAVVAGAAHTCAIMEDMRVKCWGENISGQLGDNSTTNQPTPVAVSGLSNTLALTAGWRHTCALTQGGGVKCWGNNTWGQLGVLTVTQSLTPVEVSGLISGVSAIAAGGFHTCALTTAGSVKCWGSNNAGQLGDDTYESRPTPVTVTGLEQEVIAITAGSEHSCALLVSGAIKCWGRNDSGQLGDGTTTQRLTPVSVSRVLSPVVALVAGGFHTCALTTHQLWCWGHNGYGQVGDGFITTYRLTPVVASEQLENIESVGAGLFHTCGVVRGNNLKCWGDNAEGQIGNGKTTVMTTIERYTPIDVNGLASGVSALAAGTWHTCALTIQGGVKCWGANTDGQLGEGSALKQLTPVEVAGVTTGVTAIASGAWYNCALLATGSVKCWGSNYWGQLGRGDTTDSYTPTAISVLTSGVTAITTGYGHACALTSAGGVKCWGHNESGQLGDGTTDQHETPVDVSGLISNVIAIAAGTDHTCALLTTGGVACWGSNTNGQIGGGLTTTQLLPTPVISLTSAARAITAGYQHNCALLTTGEVQCWGWNDNGQLGDGTRDTHRTPITANGVPSNVVTVTAGGYHTCVLLGTGEAQCWGQNTYSQAGDDLIFEDRLSPVTVRGLVGGVTALATGRHHTCGLLVAGSVVCWGDNSQGQLGSGTIQNVITFVGVTPSAIYTTPVLVSSLPDDIRGLTAGSWHTCAVTVDGGVKCWGANTDGQLGGSQIAQRAIPVEINGLHKGATALVSGAWYNCALMAEGNVKCWGSNYWGQLGDGTNLDRYFPTTVSDLISGVTALGAGYGHTCAILEAGDVKCWGHNLRGELGDGTTDDRTTPVAVSGITSGTRAIVGGNDHICALMTNGEVKCWGWNDQGQLGDGTTDDHPTPMNVGGLITKAIGIASGFRHNCVLLINQQVACWGWNEDGQLGDGTRNNRYQPKLVSALTESVVALAGGGYHTCALLTDGQVTCWGQNDYGQLGDGTLQERLEPVRVRDLKGEALALTAGRYHTCALMRGGGVQCWGDNSHSQLGAISNEEAGPQMQIARFDFMTALWFEKLFVPLLKQ